VKEKILLDCVCYLWRMEF